MLRRLNRLITLKAFFKDKRGVSAIEFAFVAPILIMAYLGLAELTLGMMASRRASHLAASVGDLAAQSDSLSQANVNDLFAIGTSMMQPFDTSGTSLKIRLSLLKMDTDKTAKVQWSRGYNENGYNANYVVTAVTTNQIAVGEYLVMTEVEYHYNTTGQFLPLSNTFKDTFYHHPRNGGNIAYTG